MNQSPPPAGGGGVASWTSATGSSSPERRQSIAPTDLARQYQQETTLAAMKAMERELLTYVRTVPYRPIPRYNGVPEVPRPSEQTPHPPSGNTYNRSALARCVLEKLAADIHGGEEEYRELHDYHTFYRILSAPQATQLDKLDPKVQVKQSRASSPAPGAGQAAGGAGGRASSTSTSIFPTEVRPGSGPAGPAATPGKLTGASPPVSESKTKSLELGGNSNEKATSRPANDGPRLLMDTWSQDPFKRGECLVQTVQSSWRR
jgi:hypothetical protein